MLQVSDGPRGCGSRGPAVLATVSPVDRSWPGGSRREGRVPERERPGQQYVNQGRADAGPQSHIPAPARPDTSHQAPTTSRPNIAISWTDSPQPAPR